MVERPHLSVTLPASLGLSHDLAPKTPERTVRSDPSTPMVQATQARFRLRRRPGRTISSQLFAPPESSIDDEYRSELPVPSIEIATEDFNAPPFDHFSPQNDSFLSPLTPSTHLFDLPRTPLSQTVSFDGNSWSTARQRELGECIVRPTSSCSMWSNSSDDSDSHSTVASSYGTSCTSPDRFTGAGDPFCTPSKDERFSFNYPQPEAVATPLVPRMKTKTSWTSAMDDHLWTAYQLYLQDPTATPIKTLPGNVPPLGVCHRVARQARHTWREPKLRASTARFSTPQPVGSPKFEFSQETSVSDLEEPERRAKAGTWPKLGHTRRRLRELAKNRATIAPHYLRLIAGRTPSPFSEPSARTSSRRTPNAADGPEHRQPCAVEALNSRDIRMALVTATSETMQPDAPIAQLQRDTPQPTPEPTIPAPLAFNFNDIPVPFASPIAPSTVVNGSSSVDHLMPDAPLHAPPRLGSPFIPTHSQTWTAPGRQRARGALSSAFPLPPRTDEQEVPVERHLARPSTATGPRSLRSPIHFTSSFPYNRSSGSKRRAEHPLEDTSSPRHTSHRRPGLNVDELFGPPLQAQGIDRSGARSPVEQRRVRLRGFSLGDAIMQSQQDRQGAAAGNSFGTLDVSSDDPFVDDEALFSTSLPGTHLNVTAPRVLGSPFRPSEEHARPRRFKVRHLPHNSLDSYREGLFGSIGERLEGDD